MKNPISFDEALELVYKTTCSNIEAYMLEDEHNMMGRAFGSHEGYLSEIMSGNDVYYHKVRFNPDHTVMFVQVIAPVRVNDEHLDTLLTYLNALTTNKISGRITIDEHQIIAHTSVDLETYARQLAAFAATTGVTAKAVELATPFFAPDADRLQEIEHFLVSILMRNLDDIIKANNGEDIKPAEDHLSELKKELLHMLLDLKKKRAAMSEPDELLDSDDIPDCDDNDCDDDDDDNDDDDDDDDDDGFADFCRFVEEDDD